MKTSTRKYTYPLNIEREYVYFLKRITKELRKNTLNNLDKIYEIVLKYRKLIKKISEKWMKLIIT